MYVCLYVQYVLSNGNYINTLYIGHTIELKTLILWVYKDP